MATIATPVATWPPANQPATPPRAKPPVSARGRFQALSTERFMGASASGACRESIACASDCLHHVFELPWLERLAQTTDMHVDGTLFHVHAAAPHMIQQLSARVDALRMRHEEIQQAVFGGAD